MQAVFQREYCEEKSRVLRETAGAAVEAYVKTFLVTKGEEDLGAKRDALVLWGAYKTMEFTHQRPRPDGEKGKFECKKCGMEGERKSFQAKLLRDWGCVVVEREERDRLVRLVIEEEGERRDIQGRGMGRGGGGGGGRGGGSMGRGKGREHRVSEGRIQKNRQEEKKRVLGQLVEESLMEGLDGLDF